MSAEAGVRADVWLWRARFFKTRALAASAVEDGMIRVSRAGGSRVLDKPGYDLKPGDGLSLAFPGALRTVRILAVGTRRGPASEARTLYEEAPSEGAES